MIPWGPKRARAASSSPTRSSSTFRWHAGADSWRCDNQVRHLDVDLDVGLDRGHLVAVPILGDEQEMVPSLGRGIEQPKVIQKPASAATAEQEDPFADGYKGGRVARAWS